MEQLAPGDLLVTASGRLRPVRWIGHRRIALAHHPRPWDVYPVRVHAHAIAPEVPHRDLLVSPDHALFLDGDGEGAAPGVLIPARYLCNGATIRQEAAHEVRYFHVELDAHDILLAEGLPAESYLDTGNRSAFDNCGNAVMAHADFARHVWADAACAPLVVAGAKLARVKRRLLDRAAALGHVQTADAGLCLLADGMAVWPERDGDAYRFTLQRPAAALRLVSRRTVPAELSADRTDGRRLGVAVARLTVDGRALPSHDPDHAAGWYPPEPGWQWTDGDATLPGRAVRSVEVTLVPLLRYWARRPQDGMPLVVEYSKCSALSGNTIG